jgi:hypothetical protein
MDHRPRIGTFFVLIGLGLLTLFVITVMGNEINVVYLLLSIPALFLGYIFRQRKPPSESARFGMIRRATERSRQRRQERMDKWHKK